MAENYIRNWDLADAILEQLYNCRPNRVLFSDLRNCLPQFSVIPEEEWNDALKGLSEAGLADVAPISSGFQGKWGAVVNAGISSQGEREIDELKSVEAYGDLRFQDWSEQLYADLDQAGANLREEYAHSGLLASSSYYRAAATLILDRLRGLEEAFVTCYLRAVQERTAEGVAGPRERWLRRKIESVWKHEVDRAKLNASRLCEVSGVLPDQYAPQIKELEREADALKRSMQRKLETAVIEQKLPVVAIHEEKPLTRTVTPSSVPSAQAEPTRRKVWVVYGRNEEIKESMFSFIRAIGLEPIEFSKARALTGKPMPHITEILNAAFANAHAVLILLTPDDEGRLRQAFIRPDDPQHERQLTGQARQNVIFEAGMALASHPDRTIIAEFGRLRPFSDITGFHTVRMNDSPEKKKELAQRLRDAGCPVDLDGDEWLKVRFTENPDGLTQPPTAVNPAQGSHRATHEAFAAAIEAGVLGDNGFWVVYVSRFANTISPLGALFRIHILNRQEVPATISEYELEVSDSKGHWLGLRRIPAQAVSVYYGRRDGLRRAVPTTFDALDSAIQRPIDPHGVVTGWALFEACPGLERLTGQSLFYRIAVRDYEGHSATISGQTEPQATVTAQIAPNGPPINLPGDSLRFAGYVHDLSSHRMMPYSEAATL